MGFFEGIEPSPRPKPQIVEPPEWYGPPVGIFPAASAQQATLLKSDELALIADEFLVYPNGVQCCVTVHSRRFREDIVSPFSRWPDGSGTEPPAPVRFGLQLPDGTKWTNIARTSPSRDDEPVGSVVLQKGGGGGGTRWFTCLWIWPLPAPGTITFYAAWPEEGLTEHAVQIDANELRALSAEAEALWTS